MDLDKIIVPLATAALGFLGGLATPWIKARYDALAERRTYQKAMITVWRAKLGESDQLPKYFGDSHEYASLRAHMKPDVVERFEAPRTMYVSGGRGADVRKQMLLDEIARIEKDWHLV